VLCGNQAVSGDDKVVLLNSRRRVGHHDQGPVGPRTEQDRFYLLWDTYLAKVASYALRRLRSYDDAADCAAETFSVAWEKLDQVPEGTDALYWLYAVARRSVSNQRRSARRRSLLTNRLATDMRHSDALVNLPADDQALAAAAALTQLSPEDQEILRLVSWEGLDTNGLAVFLGCTPGAARVRLHRARQRLAVRLDGAVDPNAPTAPTTTTGDRE
jgi:RNA polymerase sigma factor (sigma-70 family)